jgi:hypothetical protein
MTQLSFEYRLLLICSCCPLQIDEISRLRGLCQKELEWAVFLKLAGRHQLAPLLYANLKRHAADLVPAKTLATLKAHAEQNRRHVLELLVELNAIRVLLAPAGIVICPLKGPQLSQQLYGDVGLRVTNDLDLLLNEAQLPEAETLLQRSGYRRVIPKMELTPRQWREYQRLIHHVTYKHPNRDIYVEIHWNLVSPEFLSQAVNQQFLARARPSSSPAMVSLSDQDQLCFLIVHGARHGWARFKWLADIAMTLRQSPGPDWLAVREQMDALDLLRPLGQAVLLAHDLMSAPVPEALASLIEERPVQKLAVQALAIALSGQGFGVARRRFVRLRTIHYVSGLKASASFKISQLGKMWVFEDDWKDVFLPDWLFPLYFVLHPFLWLHRHLPQHKPKSGA